jgi:hypothetical protein
MENSFDPLLVGKGPIAANAAISSAIHKFLRQLAIQGSRGDSTNVTQSGNGRCRIELGTIILSSGKATTQKAGRKAGFFLS